MRKPITKKRKKKNKRLLIFAIICFIILLAGLGAVYYFSSNGKSDNPLVPVKTEKPEEPKLKIVDPNSKSRNYAVMINNISGVWGKQTGIQDAYIVYELTVEGGITRFLAIYKDAKTAKIGSVRSARPYYLDYVLENDAIYNHVGGSKQAKSELSSLGINHMESFYRDKTVSNRLEFTAFTSMEMMENRAKKAKYRTTTDQKLLFKYSIEEIDLSKMDGAVKADEVIIDYNSKNRSFKYDAENKVYNRYQGGNPHVDLVTKKQYTAKNIITYKVKNTTISGDKKGRQQLDNLGSGKGWYISCGWAVPITWEKTSRRSQTVYKYLNGEEIVLNDGNTFIQIQPTNKNLDIKAIE